MHHSGGIPTPPTYCDYIILAETQLIVIMAFEVQQGLGAAATVPRTGHVILVVPLVALHAVVWSQILGAGAKGYGREAQRNSKKVTGYAGD